MKKVAFEFTGDRAKDVRIANKILGMKETPGEFVWEHAPDLKTMLLVPKQIHELTGHTGGVAKKKALAGGAAAGAAAAGSAEAAEGGGFWQGAKDLAVDILTDPSTYLWPLESGGLNEHEDLDIRAMRGRVLDQPAQGEKTAQPAGE